jgi:hypothetical protein
MYSFISSVDILNKFPPFCTFLLQIAPPQAILKLSFVDQLVAHQINEPQLLQRRPVQQPNNVLLDFFHLRLLVIRYDVFGLAGFCPARS